MSISIHALRMERDLIFILSLILIFHFYPRAPHGARQEKVKSLAQSIEISIHALRMERDGRI